VPTLLAPPSPLTVLRAVARRAADAVGTALDGRVAAGPPLPGWTTDDQGGAYVSTTTIAGPTPQLRGDGGRSHGWVVTVQVDLWERERDEDPAIAAALLAAFAPGHTDTQAGAARWRLDLETAERSDADLDPGWVRHRLDVRVTVLR
jgi:hypothetical protein